MVSYGLNQVGRRNVIADPRLVGVVLEDGETLVAPVDSSDFVDFHAQLLVGPEDGASLGERGGFALPVRVRGIQQIVDHILDSLLLVIERIIGRTDMAVPFFRNFWHA
jgi:hypothetical protein